MVCKRLIIGQYHCHESLYKDCNRDPHSNPPLPEKKHEFVLL